MFDIKYARRQCLGGVAGQDRYRGLPDNRPFVHAFCHEMHGAAGNPHAGVNRALMRVQTGNIGSSEG